ncbi:SBBP repeat-containing protein [Serratia sp. CY50710]|uniref:DUF7948 domain-containing protein n=2 Tax=Serratia TaxID=613 RepID=UPI0018D8F0F7|nr:SBBP repeat-containing protein [Serratia ureilytica]MBH2554021.1 hypothetical protein [Serratia ureilytica]
MNIRSLRMPFRYAPASLFVIALSLLSGAHAADQQPKAKPDTAQVQHALQGLAIPFEANNGQFDERVAFVGRTFAGPVFVTREGQIVYSLPATETKEGRQAWILTETLVDARALNPYGGEQAATQVSRFTGPKSYQAATYRNVMLGQAWPGIEVELAARGSNVEKLFHVKPHADVDRIQVRLAGAESLRLGEAGELIATTGHGDIAYTAPVAFQQVGGKRLDVPVKYVLNEAGDGYGFALGMYDRTRPLVIDPLLQSTYLGGGEGEDVINAMAIDARTGDVLVTGYTSSGDFPGTAGGAQAQTMGGAYSGFVARLSGDLKTLLQSTYLNNHGSGAGNYLAYAGFYALAIDEATGNVVVGGVTGGATGYPGTAGGALPEGGDGASARVLSQLSGDLKTLRQSTYLGSGWGVSDAVSVLAIDPANGDIVVSGMFDTDPVPGTAGGALPERPNASGGDGYLVRLSGDLKTLRQGTYMGGMVRALVIDPRSGDVVAGGRVSGAGLAGASGGAQPAPANDYDGYLSRLSGDLKTLRQSTYLGGSDSGSVIHSLGVLV